MYEAAFSISLISLWWLVKPDPGFTKSPHIGQGIFVLSGLLSCWDASGSCVINLVINNKFMILELLAGYVVLFEKHEEKIKNVFQHESKNIYLAICFPVVSMRPKLMAL